MSTKLLKQQAKHLTCADPALKNVEQVKTQEEELYRLNENLSTETTVEPSILETLAESI